MVQRPWVFRHRMCCQPQSSPEPGLGVEQVPVHISSRRACPARGAPGPETGGGAGSSTHLVPARMPSTWGAWPWDWGRSRFQSPSHPGAHAQHVGCRALRLGAEQVPVPISSRRACPARGAPGPGTGGGAGSSPRLLPARLPSTWSAGPCLPHSLRFPPGPWLSSSVFITAAHPI